MATKRKAAKPKAKPKSKPKARPKKKANPRIRRKAKPKPKAKSKSKRSAAAKRGWQTRRKNQLDKAVKRGARRQRRENPELMQALDELQKEKGRSEALRLQIAQLEKDYVVRDALVESLIQAGQLVESDETRIIARLRLAQIDGAFEEEVGMLADEFNMQPSEIYSLWFSP